MSDDEVPLQGGRTTAGVVRIQNTVRRPQAKNSPFIHDFLAHLQNVGFDAAPNFLGVDEKGREILSFIEGNVPADLGLFSDDDLIHAARLTKRFHEASSSFPGKGENEVVCHNDLSPCNFVFRERPTAIIDFDAAAPGSREWDVGYALWLWLNISYHYSPEEQGRRISLFCREYGFDPERALPAMYSRQDCFLNRAECSPWVKSCKEWLQTNETAILKALD